MSAASDMIFPRKKRLDSNLLITPKYTQRNMPVKISRMGTIKINLGNPKPATPQPKTRSSITPPTGSNMDIDSTNDNLSQIPSVFSFKLDIDNKPRDIILMRKNPIDMNDLSQQSKSSSDLIFSIVSIVTIMRKRQYCAKVNLK